MLLLALDTSSPTSGVCLLEDGHVRAELTVRARNPQEADHIGNLEEVLRRAKCRIEDIDAFACALGPGGFTGLRVGLSLLKGLTADGARPLFGVSTLAALARRAGNGPWPVVPCLDARRGEVYAAVFLGHSVIVPEGAYEPQAFSDLVAAKVSEPTLWIGEGSRVYRTVLQGGESGENGRGGRYFCGPEFEHPGAAAVGALAWEAWERGERPSAVELVPNYLRAPAAELNAGSQKPV